jgi:hypothetical protein
MYAVPAAGNSHGTKFKKVLAFACDALYNGRVECPTLSRATPRTSGSSTEEEDFMTQRALFRLRARTNDALLATTMGLAVILLGCGGGGSGGGVIIQPGACGSAANSGITAICGRVVRDDVGGSAVAGATVSLLNASGASIATTVTTGSGSFLFNGPGTSAGALVMISTPVGYTTNYVRYNSATYDQSRRSRDNSTPCVPAVAAVLGNDKDAGRFTLFSDTGAPPPPVFQCPR